MELNDFKQSTPLTVADFGKLPPTGPNLNESSAAQVAGTYAILQGGRPADYQSAKSSLLDPASRDEFLTLHQNLRDAIWEDAQSSLTSYLGDPTEPEQDRLGVLGTVKSLAPSSNGITVSKLPPMSSLETLAQEAAVADSGPDESERVEEFRNSSIDSIKEVVNNKRQLTAAINSLAIGRNDVTAKKIKDVAELLVPFAEWRHYDNLAASLDGSDYRINLLGEQKRKLFDRIKSIPLDKRMEYAQTIMDLINENQTLVLPDGNDIVALQDLQRMLIDNDYSNTTRYLDNISSILDIAGVGGLIRGLAKPAKIAKGLEGLDEASKMGSKERVFTTYTDEAGAVKQAEVLDPDPAHDAAMSYTTRTDVVPTSPSQTVKDFNPDLARQFHKMVENDESGEVAKALYGSSKTEALAKDILPEPGTTPKEIPEKVEMPKGPDFPEPSEIRKVRQENGNTIVTDAELKTIQTKLTEGFRNVEGMTLHPSSMIVRLNEDATIGFTARYSPVDSGFKTAREALDNAAFAFRKYGLTDENFSLLVKSGDKWKEVSLEDAEAVDKLNAEAKTGEAVSTKVKTPKPNYAIAMKYDYRFNPDDWNEAEMLTTAPSIVARGVQFLDRIPTQFMARMGQGSIVQNLLDNASLIHPRIVNAASVAVDRAYRIKKIYVDEFEKFTKDYKQLTADRKVLMTDYIHQANLEGIKMNAANLYSRGFTKKEVEILKKWQRANDIMWYAANDDMAISLRSKGYESFVHKGSDTKLFGRPMTAQTAYSEKWLYDPVDGKTVQWDKAAIDKLYEQNGTMFRLSEPTNINGRWVDTVISRNTPDGGYLRRIPDGEHVLAYRDGYYPVAYDGNYILTKEITKAGGVKSHKAIGVARNQNEVKTMLKKLRASDSKAVFSYRLDRSHSQNVSRIFDEGAWSVASNSGITSQRIRGARLGDAGVDLEKMGNAHLKDPLEAVQGQIHQLSQRVAVRPYLDAAKKRWMLNYEKYIDLKVNPESGKVDMPSSITDIVAKPGAPSKYVAAARTNFNYISSLENGYINLIDETYRGITQAMAQLLGEYGFGKGEELLFKGSKGVPSQAVRTLSFKLLLAASPLRQAVVQRGQILQLAVINPEYFAGPLFKDLIELDRARYGFSNSNYYNALWDEVKNSGVIEAVDAHNLIRDDMLQLADMSVGQKVANAAGAPLRAMQKIGFDAAEQDVLLSSWLVHRDLALKAGANLDDQRVKDEILGQSRAFTLNMNRSGEMPYSRNTLSMMAQFFAFQHKAFLQGITNTSLTKMERIKLLGFTTALWGVGATPVALLYSMIPDDTPSEVRKPLEQGLFTMVLNTGLTMLSGKDQSVDWRDMAPSEAYGIGNVFVGMLDTPISSIMMGGPTSSLLFGGNPKLRDAFMTGMKYFDIKDDYEDPKLETKFTDVLRASASTFSGFSALFKARYAMQTGIKLSSTGKVTDDDVTGIEAFMAAAGFRTLNETGMSAAKEVMYGEKAFEDNDVINWYMELKRHLARRGQTPVEDDMGQRVLSEAWRVFNDERPRAIEVIKKQLEKDSQNGDYIVMKGILSKMGFLTEAETWDQINALPDGPMKENLIETMKIREDMRNGN